MSRIAKIKTKDGLITIIEVSGKEGSNSKTTEHKLYDDPHPDFTKAMQDLVTHVRTILEWPTSYGLGSIHIGGVSFSFSEDTEVEGAVISGSVGLDTSDSPFSFNTPHLPFEQYAEGNTAKLMPEDAQDALELLRKEAREYLKGKRAQGSLFPLAAE